jgi:hypothetical protein
MQYFIGISLDAQSEMDGRFNKLVIGSESAPLGPLPDCPPNLFLLDRFFVAGVDRGTYLS